MTDPRLDVLDAAESDAIGHERIFTTSPCAQPRTPCGVVARPPV